MERLESPTDAAYETDQKRAEGWADASEKLVARRWSGVVQLLQRRWSSLLTVRTLAEQPYAQRETSWETTAFCAVLAEKAAGRSGDCAARAGQRHATICL